MSSLHKLNIYSFFLVALLSISSLYAQTVPGDTTLYHRRLQWFSDNPKQSVLDLRVDSMLQSYMQSPENCGISIGVFKAGKTYFYNYGDVNRGAGIHPDKNTLYELGAISAVFCGKLLDMAVAEKKISLQEDIRRYLPGKYENLSYNRKSIRIQHLAEHSAGLEQIPADLPNQPDFEAKDPYKNYTKEQVFNYLHKVALRTEPGKTYNYSSFGIALLGLILERVYNSSYETLVKEKILFPKGLNNTILSLSSQSLSQMAQGYNLEGDSTGYWHMNAFAAAGGYKSSCSDMLRYIQLSIGDTNPQLSWLVRKTQNGSTFCYQSGGTYGFSGFAAYLKNEEAGLIVLSNSAQDVQFLSLQLLDYLK